MFRADVIDQLKTERRTGANAYGTTHVYDPAGNRTRLDRSTVNPGGWTFTYDAANELTVRQNNGTQTYTFDADGNMLSSPFTIAQLANAWDYENRLRMTRLPTTPPLTLTYGYDADNRLRQKTQNFVTVATETFDWDANWNLAGTSGGSIYIPEPGLYGLLVAKRESGTLYFPLFDAIGSAILVVDASGAVQSTRRYSAYGTALDTVAGPLGDVGWLGEHGYLTGLSLAYLYVRNRWYHPELARWLSKDPAVDDRVNLYRYVRNRPLFLLDPSGLECCTPQLVRTCCHPASTLDYNPPEPAFGEIGLCTRDDTIIVDGLTSTVISWIQKFDHNGEAIHRIFNQTTNQPPPDYLSRQGARRDPSRRRTAVIKPLADVIVSKDFRNIVQIRPRIRCCKDTEHLFIEDPVVSDGFLQKPGFTPQPIVPPGRGPIYLQGEAGPPIREHTVGPDDCVRFLVRARFRVNVVENIGQSPFSGGLLPYAWAEIKMMLCCDGSYGVSFTGSVIPSYYAYYDDAVVKKYFMTKGSAVANLRSFMSRGFDEDAPPEL